MNRWLLTCSAWSQDRLLIAGEVLLKTSCKNMKKKDLELLTLYDNICLFVYLLCGILIIITVVVVAIIIIIIQTI